jgi:hypothetical protein
MRIIFKKYQLQFSLLNKKVRKWLLFVWLILIFAAISSIFWYNEWVYSLPTPVPLNYHSVNSGQYINIPTKLGANSNKPLFLHFFNPDCPCSKFNIPHFKSLVKQYGDKVNFEIVAMCRNRNYTEEEIQNKFSLTVPVLFDTTLATACGVYSTPQAVILDTHSRLYYRGNYNKARYCTDLTSNYAKMALDSLLNNNSYPNFGALAVKAYGCQLPKCNIK